jgi:hypothetical protein
VIQALRHICAHAPQADHAEFHRTSFHHASQRRSSDWIVGVRRVRL